MSLLFSVQKRHLQDATDANLRQLIYSHQYVLTKFVDPDCTICERMAPHLERLAADPRFAHVLFLRIQAHENPVAVKEVSFNKAPFIATYHNGRLLHCETVFSDARVEEILLSYLPALVD